MASTEEKKSIGLSEVIRKVGTSFHLMSKDGKKLLGKFDSMDKAKDAEKRAQRFGKEGMVGLAINDKGKPITEHGGVFDANDLTEAHLGSLSDEELKGLRKTFINARIKVQKKHVALPDEQKFASPQGQQMLADMEYNSMVIRRLEFQMADRYLTLD